MANKENIVQHVLALVQNGKMTVDDGTALILALTDDKDDDDSDKIVPIETNTVPDRMPSTSKNN